MQYSEIPNVNQLLELPVFEDVGKAWATHIVRVATAEVRDKIRSGQLRATWTLSDWTALLTEVKIRLSTRRYQKVINATGIVVHTNLGRAPLATEVVDYMMSVTQYTDLELSLDTGTRGGRISGIRDKICQITGAEDALVVNNNAAAVLLTLSAVASGKEVVVSRGELVEIGGSFRIPNVIQQGGAILKEVGCTNRTRVADFAAGITDNTGALLRVHPSNYQIVGFTERANRRELAQLAEQHGLPLIDDLGSGLLVRAPDVPWKRQLEEEESIAGAIQDGVSLVCASGDKLLGGVQAGLIVGRADLVSRCRQHPLYRALRLDKVMLAGLEATLQIHLEERSSELPVWRYLERTPEDCLVLAEQLVSGLPEAGLSVQAGESLVGGGASPDRVLPTWTVVVQTDSPNELAYALRTGSPAIMTRIQNDAVVLDMRTIEKGELPDLQKSLIASILSISSSE